jgi:hypothetical protein
MILKKKVKKHWIGKQAVFLNSPGIVSRLPVFFIVILFGGERSGGP